MRSPPRSRKAFWIFVAAIVLAAAGGGAIAALGRSSVAGRKGHPDTIAPAELEARGSADPLPRAAGTGERPAARDATSPSTPGAAPAAQRD